MIRLQRYMLTVQYVPGNELNLPDTLSRAYLFEEPSKDALEAAEEMEVMISTLVENLPLSSDKLEDLKRATRDDQVLQTLTRTIKTGWSRYRKSSPPEIRQYWNLKDEVHVIDGLVLLGDRVIIPTLRPEMLRRIHESHLGAEKCKARARAVMYWPKMSEDIDTMVAACHVCLTFRKSNQRQPLKPHQIPQRPWQVVGADVMTFKSSDYLVVVDYYSKFPELARLESKTAKCIIMHMKSMYARHEIPEQLVCDNMPFASREFGNFAADWGIHVKTSSPEYPQSNGQSERMIQTIKQLLRKADAVGLDPYITLLEYRNTPVCGITSSPAQLLMSRMLRDKLPATGKLLEPTVTQKKLKARQERHKHYFDHGTKELPPLNAGDSVRIRRGKTWEPAVLTKALTDRPRS